MAYHVGIDPGATGGIAIIDSRGQFVAAHRWQGKDPASLYQLLISIAGEIDNNQVYIERVQNRPGEGLAFVLNNFALIENAGIWQGFILAAGLAPVLVHPATWQNAFNLAKWQAKAKANPNSPTPLTLARQLWPAAPLACLADDGKAVALILAALAHRDKLSGLDRAALNCSREIKAKAERAKARQKRKAGKINPTPPNINPSPWPPGPRPLDDRIFTQPLTQVQPGSPHHRAQVKPLFTPTAQKR